MSLSSTSTTAMRDAASGTGVFIGAAGNAGYINSGDESYSSLLGEQFNLITAENACKWSATEKSRGKYNFDDCDVVADFAKENDMAFRGHNLCWGVYNPSWLENGNFNSTQLTDILTDHIDAVVGHYGDSAYGWDVVNEALTDDGSADDPFKSNVWYDTLPTYVDVAFTAARAAAGDDVKLFYNDYNVGSSTGWSATKSQRMYDMVKSMVDRGIPIDGVGLQMHITLGYDQIDGVKANMQRYGDLGLEVHITELDISCAQDSCDSWGDDEKAEQAQLYADLLQACLDVDACKNFESWGFTDLHSWKGTDQHPLQFDENYNAKPAVDSILDTLKKSR